VTQLLRISYQLPYARCNAVIFFKAHLISFSQPTLLKPASNQLQEGSDQPNDFRGNFRGDFQGDFRGEGRVREAKN